MSIFRHDFGEWPPLSRKPSLRQRHQSLSWSCLSVHSLNRTLPVQPLSVPRSVAEAGFTAEIAAVRLRDAITDLAGQAKTSAPRRKIMQQADLVDVVVPTIGISVQSLAAQFRTFLGIKRRQTISGEVTTEGGLLFLTLRLDGTRGVDRERPAELLADAARAALRATQPYIFAVLVYDSDKSCR